MAAASQLGYVRSYSASSLASGRHHNVGVIVPAVDRWYFSTVLEGISTSLRAEGYDLTLYNSGGGAFNRALLDDFLLRKRIDAIVVIGSRLDGDDIARLRAVRKPLIAIGGSLPGVCAIEIDDSGASAAATAHLIGLGHRRIAHIAGCYGQRPSFDSSPFHRDEYQSAMKQAGLRTDGRWIARSDFTIAGGRLATRKLLLLPEQERPSAILCSSDEMAVGAILAARELKLTVPGELSVIGIGGNEVGEAFGLTTVNQFAHEQGQRAVQHLLSQLRPSRVEDPARREVVRSELVVRGSTAVPAVESSRSAECRSGAKGGLLKGSSTVRSSHTEHPAKVS